MNFNRSSRFNSETILMAKNFEIKVAENLHDGSGYFIVHPEEIHSVKGGSCKRFAQAYTSEYDSSAAPPAHRINRKLDICLFVSLFASIILIDID